MVRKLQFTVFFVCILSRCLSQNIDSLESLLNRPGDTVKIITLNNLSNIYFAKGNYAKSDSFATKAKAIAEQINYPLGIYNAYINLNSIAWSKDQITLRIDLLTKALKIVEDLKRPDLIIESKFRLATAYRDYGFKAKSRKLVLEAYTVAVKLNDKKILRTTLRNMAMRYADDGDYAQAVKYYSQTLTDEGTQNFAVANSNIALNYARLNKFDSAIYFHEKAIKAYEKLYKESGTSLNMAYLLTMEGETYSKFNDYEHALACFNRAIKWHKEVHPNPRTYAYGLLNISEIMLKKEKGHEVNLQAYQRQILDNLEQAIKIFKTGERYPNLLRSYAAAREVNMLTGNYKAANEYAGLYIVIKDTITNREQRAKVKELNIQYQAQEQEQKIAQLQKEKSANTLLIALLSGLLVISVLSVFLFVSRQRLHYKNEKRQLELTALRSQMNPHFIFNCLNSISRYVVKSQVTEATNYLTSFAKLMRCILDNSKHSMMALQEEIKTISLYLELEAMRFHNRFSYTVHVEEGLDAAHIKIPPMVIQPFIENAIWHGLHHKPEHGRVDINFSIRDKFLVCTIEDDGVGRRKALEFEKANASFNKGKSYGIQITKERLNSLSWKGLKTSLKIIDLFDTGNNPVGTKVEIAIPVVTGE
ncbi:hypothetical protein WSM22_19100 [Cytophagales bacterium WSM2-2]|nr:hypothetical protein WSM22_19100 [Cytophagales bacterium WSM2-2]